MTAIRVWTAKDGSDLPPFIVEEVHKKVAWCYEKADAFFKREFPRCKVQFGVTGTYGGWASYGKNLIKLNSEFLLRQFRDMIDDTIPHEVAHLITYQVFKKGKPWEASKKVKPHGAEWKTVMMAVFGIEAKRCHSYKTGYVLNQAGSNYRRVPVNPHTGKRGFDGI